MCCIGSPFQISSSDCVPTLPTGDAVKHVALAARIYVAVVLHVHRPAPKIVAGMRPILGRMPAIRTHQVRFIGFDANLIDTWRIRPEPHEVVHFVPVLLHPHHLNDDLHLALALVLHAGKAQEVVADAFEAGALAVVLEGFFGRTVEAERDVFQRRRKQLLGAGFIEQRAVG